MARRQQLSENQLAELFDPPVEQRELVCHYTVSSKDLAAAQRCRGDHNRLGYALMLCYLRHPGRALRAGKHPPAAMVAFVAEQVGTMPGAMDDYVATERSRQRHAIECQDHLGLRPFGRRACAELLDALLSRAIENDKLAVLAGLVMLTCRERRIVAPSPAVLERLCSDLRHQARREVHRRLTQGLSAEQRRGLDGPVQRRENKGQNWLRQMLQAAKPSAGLGLIARDLAP